MNINALRRSPRAILAGLLVACSFFAAVLTQGGSSVVMSADSAWGFASTADEPSEPTPEPTPEPEPVDDGEPEVGPLGDSAWG